MFSFRKRIGRTAVATVLSAGIAVGATVLSTSTPALATNNSDTVTFALPPSVTPSYILPIMSGADFSNVNFFQFQEMMFRPLYWFGKGTSPTFNESLSLALPPVYSNGGKTVTIKLKSYNWSDGKPVTARDVLFFMNMLKAETKVWVDFRDRRNT